MLHVYTRNATKCTKLQAQTKKLLLVLLVSAVAVTVMNVI